MFTGLLTLAYIQRRTKAASHKQDMLQHIQVKVTGFFPRLPFRTASDYVFTRG